MSSSALQCSYEYDVALDSSVSGHFVRLQSLDENHVLVNDPARDSRALTKLTYEEARAMGYFATRFVIRSSRTR